MGDQLRDALARSEAGQIDTGGILDALRQRNHELKNGLTVAKPVSEHLDDLALGKGIKTTLVEARCGTAQVGEAAEYVLRKTRLIGASLGLVDFDKGGRPKKTPDIPSGVTLSALGISEKQSSRWQKLASVPDDSFESYVSDTRSRCAQLSMDGALKIDPALGGDSGAYDSDEWYTPALYVNAAREVLGGIDLDPASNKHAQKTIKAARYFTSDDDGLSKTWKGRVWLNPPYSQPLASDFGEKLLAEIEAGNVSAAIMVQNASTDTEWFHRLASKCELCLTRGRINFDRVDGESAANRYGQVFFYFGPDAHRFRGVFGEFGLVGKLQ